MSDSRRSIAGDGGAALPPLDISVMRLRSERLAGSSRQEKRPDSLLDGNFERTMGIPSSRDKVSSSLRELEGATTHLSSCVSDVSCLLRSIMPTFSSSSPLMMTLSPKICSLVTVASSLPPILLRLLTESRLCEGEGCKLLGVVS